MSFIRLFACVVLAHLSACTSPDSYSFGLYGQKPNSKGVYSPFAKFALTDEVAMNYSSNIATVLRARATGARVTREVSASLQVILAGLAGAHQAFNLSNSAIAVLGLGSAAIPEFQGIFNAKGRATVYQDAVRLIEEAQIEYLAHNQRPTSVLTQNGVTLLQRVTASIHVVEKTLVGSLPTILDMQQATEPMSVDGATPTPAGSAPVNVVPARGKPPVVKLTPVVVRREVVRDEGLQPQQIAAITAAAGPIVRRASKEQGQIVATEANVVVLPDEDPREAISKELGGSSISAGRAADLLRALQKHVP